MISLKLVILGAGGHGQVVADIANQTGIYDEIIFLDDNAETAGDFGNVEGKCADFLKFKNKNTQMYPAFGNNEARVNWENKFLENGISLPKIIHPLAYVSKTSEIAEGTVVFPYAVVNTGCKIEKACIINFGSIIDHGNYIEEGCHIEPGAVVKAENRVPRMTKLESNEIIPIRFYKTEK